MRIYATPVGLGEAIEERESARVEFAAGHIAWLCGEESSGSFYSVVNAVAEQLQHLRGLALFRRSVTTPAASRAARAAPFAPYPRTRGDT